MKERPILFSGPMVRALLDDSKTQTRRIAKYPVAPHFCEMQERSIAFCEWEGAPCCGTGVWDVPYHSAKVPCPYGQPGDRLWVRETTRSRFIPNIFTGEPTTALCGEYAADSEPVLNEAGFDIAWWYSRRSCPAIHMPRWASRITLEITGVRVERLQDISYEDALSEGVADFSEMLNNEPSAIGETPEATARRLRWPQRWFESLWTDINGADSWNANPWVWVVEFRRLSA